MILTIEEYSRMREMYYATRLRTRALTNTLEKFGVSRHSEVGQWFINPAVFGDGDDSIESFVKRFSKLGRLLHGVDDV